MGIILKGGVWKNTEDEILKAAVMKYGKNQWARISSLLNRKTPKQCKARWYEWLDPSIRKTEWSKEEDEKLLHLAKLMPTQWRTIAPIVGRTPSQCLERYQRLLDEAEQREAGEGEGDVEAGPTADDVRRLRPGEIDPDPETKPARPDPVDMDEDEKEMLSEARARLANTQGKKAKRKARERQLEEARRLASVQKHRELKAAGIDWKPRLRRGEFDYNNEIPFQTEIPAGFYDVSEENERTIEKITRGSKEQFEGKTRAQIEQENRRKDAAKKKQLEKQGLYPSMKPPPVKHEQFTAKRRKLNLPAPQLGEGELEEIVKIGQSIETSSSVINNASNANDLLLDTEQHKRQLSQHFSARATHLSSTTPMITDIVRAEAANLLALQNAQTPLLGGELRELREDGTGFVGQTPQRLIQQTPSSLTGAAVSTPSIASQIGRTPLRQGINNNNYEDSKPQINLTDELDFGFSQMPKPRNEFEIVMTDEVSKEKEEDTSNIVVPDKADEERKRLAAREEERRLKRELLSTVCKRSDLPRPKSLQESEYLTLFSGAAAESLIGQELIRMIKAEALECPIEGCQIIPNQGDDDVIGEFTVAQLSNARQLISDNMKEDVTLTDSNVKLKDDVESNLNSLSHTFQSLNNQSEKLEKRLNILLGGYQNRSATINQKISENYSQLQLSAIQLESFRRLEHLERTVAAPVRLQSITVELERVRVIERREQERYPELTTRTE